MGKKAKFKAIRKMAKELPSLQRSAVEKENCLGIDLIKQGITIINDKPVEPNKLYIKSTSVKVPVNHNRAMKKMYMKHGTVGIAAYGKAVKNFVDEQKEKQVAGHQQAI